MNELRIVLVGPTRVGKTSILTAMYDIMAKEVDSFPKEPNSDGWELQQDDPTRGRLNERRKELKKLATGNGKIVQEMGIPGDAVVTDYKFEFTCKNEVQLAIHVTDVPGGLYVSPEKFPDYPTAKKLIQEAHVFIIVVDAVALMERPAKNKHGVGRWHELVNEPDAIFNAYRADMRHAKDHSVLFVLAKAETYFEKRQEEMLTALKAGYADLLGFMRTEGVKAFACAVETVGAIRLHVIREENGVPVASFFRHTNAYAPRNCELPLRYALKVLLRAAVTKAKSVEDELDTVLRRLWEWVGGETDLGPARKKRIAFEELMRTIVEKIGAGLTEL